MTAYSTQSRTISFHVFGVPRPQPRPRFINGRPISTTGKARAWRTCVEAECRRIMARLREVHSGTPAWLCGPLEVCIDFYFPIKDTKRWGQPHTARPDKDNLEKAMLDAMEKAGMLPKGDAKVAGGETRKWWSQTGGVAVTVTVCKAVTDWGDPWAGTPDALS